MSRNNVGSNGPQEAKVIDVKGCNIVCKLTSSEHNDRVATISGISYNRKVGRKFKNGDEVHVIIVSEDPLQVSLTKEYVKPLLIFDMHGVLGEREPYKKGKPRRFIRRPFSQEFIHFCAELFEIAVWSCAMKKNIDLNMFDGISLIFVWTQDESTNLYPYMSIVSDHKPLFLKDLSTVWAKFPSYDVTNTILLDNHIEKCERNPLGTCLIVPDFITENADDSIIHPGGEIAVHLQQMTLDKPDGLHISRYVANLAGTSSLFPTSYEANTRKLDPKYTGPKLNSTFKHNEKPVTMKTAEENKLAEIQIGGVVTRSKKKDKRLVKFLRTVLEKDEAFIKDAYAKNFFHILPRHLISRDELRSFAGDRESIILCDSLVGSIVFFIIDPVSKEMEVIFSNLVVHKVCLPTDPKEKDEVEDWMDEVGDGLSVFVGELGESTEGNLVLFLCLDVLMLNGTRLCTKKEGKDRLLMDRISRVNGWLFNSPLDDIYLQYKQKPLMFKCKEYFPYANITKLLQQVEVSKQHEENSRNDSFTMHMSYPSLPSYESSGIVFMTQEQAYFDYMAAKWLPANNCTVDASISLRDIYVELNSRCESGVIPTDLSSIPDCFSVEGVFRHEDAATTIEKISVSIIVSDVPDEIIHFLNSHTDAITITETCLAACRLNSRGEQTLAGKEEFIVVKFYSLSERRVLSLEDINAVRRASSENISMTELV